MFHFIVSILFIVVFNDIDLIAGWNPANFSFNPGDNFEIVWQDEFENVDPVKAIIDGTPVMQNNQLIIVAIREGDGHTSGMLSSQHLQEFTFGVFAAKIRLSYGKGIWPAWWLRGDDHRYNLTWPTVGEIHILEMWGGNKMPYFTDQYVHGTMHWDNQSNIMNPVYNKQITTPWRTPDGSMPQ